MTPFDGNPIAPEIAAFLAQSHRLLIDGQWVEGSGSHVTSDPATGLPLATFAIGGAAEVDAAVKAARRAFEGPWGRLTAAERTRLLFRVAELLDQRAALFTELDIVDNGMPRFISELTVANCVEMTDYYAGAVMRIEGTTTPPPRHLAALGEALTYTLREPVGVGGMIIPWNSPLAMAILKLAPALAAGCTLVVKPSEETPLTALALGQVLLDAGLPPGVVNVVNGFGADAGAAIAAHPGIDKVAFTGSTATGRRIVEAALGNLKKVSLELGGKSPVVVMPDADLAEAIPGVAMATYFLQGQNCMAGTRIFAHAAIHDQLVEGLKAFSEAMVLGHGLNPATQQGPLISATQLARVKSHIESALAEGATLVTGGQSPDRPGHFLQPTIFTDTRPNMRIQREEIFGPVMAIERFETDDLDAIATRANDSIYGLSGSVWTRDLSTAHRLVRRIHSGHVSINCHGAVGTNIPFGGTRQSGWGREFGREGLDAWLETKAVTAKL
ncbi:aldehyde dehydrogenase family protein [Sandaracinobacteroides hominis]|uniref:aldehyde dehydrogenase family protein n=1 Tax=Sandaracinobacteroides hominis TaxID=2780086 RepID=UPI0018F652F0|nr:aldehyde dehydrogenase family protein [Sandaracinobacteroides hominis]